jgi:Zn-dependent M28 family amino/carboxypeptidase
MAPVEELPLTNVVGVIPGRRDNELVLFGSHYDAFGILEPVDGDSIANGANDCASGTTAVIELARYFRTRRKPERTLIFAAFTAEEIGFLGSEYLARQLDPEEIVAMFSIANIGRVCAEGPNTAIITGFERSDFGTILQRAVEGTPYSFHPDPYVRRTLFRRSDNVSFARLGVPAHGIGTAGAAEDRHTVSDEVETLDLMNMTQVIRAIALGAAPIVSGEATPTRIDPPLRPE